MKPVPQYFSFYLLAAALLPPPVSGVEPAASELQFSPVRENSISGYTDKINALEVRRGPYDPQLIAPLISLGLVQHENARYENADTSLNRALQIHRINNGLYTLSQLPALELIINNNIKRQNWRSLNDNYRYYHWLYQRNYAATELPMLTVIDKLIAWHLLAVNLDAGPHPGEHFIKLLDLTEQALNIVKVHEPDNKEEVARRLYKLALIHYYIAIAVQRGAPIGQYLVQKFNPIQNGESYESSSEKIVRKRFRQSRKLVHRIAELYRESTGVPGGSAIAILYLADWDLLFDRKHNARRGYKLAYHSLLAQGYSRTQVNAFFSQPKLLPKADFSADLMLQHVKTAKISAHTETSEPDSSDVHTTMQFVGWSTALPGVKYPQVDIHEIVVPRSERYSLVSFNVQEDGLTENIRISNTNPERDLPRHATYNAIWSAQFRPKLLDGEAVAVNGISSRFYLPAIDRPD